MGQKIVSVNRFWVTIFASSGKKDPRPKWTIYRHVSEKNRKYVSVGNFGTVSVVCSLWRVCSLHQLI